MASGVRAAVFTRVSDLVAKWAPRLSGIFVEGVEVTQGLQYRGAEQHLTDPADRGADNSLTLVADKPAMVRVFVRALRFPVANVTGTITVQRLKWGVWVDSGTLAQQFPGTITAPVGPVYATERGSRWSSLQFALPGSLLRGGLLRLKVEVHQQGDPAVAAATTLLVGPSYRQTLRLRGIPVRYWGPDASGNQIRVDAPTLADFQAETAWTLTAWPVSPTPDVTLAGTFTQNQPLTGNIVGGACPQSWLDLLFWLGIARVIDGNDQTRLYYALMPTAIPVGNAGGCGGGGGVGAGFVGGNGGVTMAHELGHVLGFSHAPCNLTAGDPNDPSYPAYEPYDSTGNRQASIGEYGYDVTTDSIRSPATTADFMSYCGNAWISLYHFAKLVPNDRLDPQVPTAPRDTLPPYVVDGPVSWPPAPPEPPWDGFVRPGEREGIIVVGGRIRDDEVDVRLVLRVDAVAQPAGRRVVGLQAELIGEGGEIIARAPVHRLTLQAGCGGCVGHGGGEGDEPVEGLLEAMLPDPAARGEHPGAALRIVRAGAELWRRDAPERPPTVGEVEAAVDGDAVHVRWRTDAADGAALDRFVRWSADAGETWQLLAAGLTGDEAEVEVRTMTSGPVLIQPLVTDGFHTVGGEPARLEVEARPPQVAVLWPARGATVRAGQPVRLWGTATASDGRTIPDEDLRWELDGERLEPGGDIRVPLGPAEGEHVAVLHAREGDRSAVARVVFGATGSGEAPHRADTGRG